MRSNFADKFLACFVMLAVIALCCCAVPGTAKAASAKATDYPPPPSAGEPIRVEDTIYGVLRNHRTLRGMLENREVLSHEVDRARAGFGPKVDLSGRGGYSLLDDSSTRASGLDDRFHTYIGLSAKLVQPIWDGFASRSRVRSAKSTLESVKERVFDTATALSLDGIIAHIDLLRRRKLYELAEENVQIHQTILARVQERVEGGTDVEADVQHVNSRLYRAKSALSEAKAQVLVAEDTYTRLTRLPSTGKMMPVTMPPELFNSPDAVFELAKQYNPHLIAYMHDIRTARADRELADSAFYPVFNVEVGPDYTDRGGRNGRWVYSFDILATVRWNIFNSGADVAEHKAASARIRQARQVMYNYVDDLKLEIDSTWTNYLSAQEQFKHYASAIKYNEFTRSAYYEQYEIGKRSLLDLLDTENELYNSKTQAETSRGNILVGAYRLCALTGNLLPQMSINTAPLAKKPVEDKEDPREPFSPGWFE